jgi:predicted phosphodiesterase
MPVQPAGRNCPIDYRYGARALAAPASLAADSLWVAGGLYGNAFALAELERMVAADAGALLVFNGDFHWFDVDAGAFEQIESGIARHIATQGNIEAELASPRAGAGCGCAYPEWVGDATVEHSNRIMARLQATAARVPGAAARLAALPMHRVAQVGGVRVAIVHGDAESLAGWGFSQETLATGEGRRAALAAFAAANVRVFASSHTCLPVLQSFAGGRIVVNNGSAGMPNFAGTGYGLATRIGATPHGAAVYGARSGPVHVEAIPIRFDERAWREAFLVQWPEDSDAHRSYYARIVDGPAYSLREALRAA